MTSETITKADLADAVSVYTGLSTAETSKMVTDVFNEIKNDLIAGNNVTISSLGCFRILHKKARMGRNPKTKKDAVITPRDVVAFHPSAVLRKYINK